VQERAEERLDGWKGRFIDRLRGGDDGDDTSASQLPARFSNVRPLGAGGMGEVFAADDDQLGRPVAVKRLAPGVNAVSHEERFRREGQALARLRHSGVAQVHELIDSDDALLLVLERVEGPSLAERLEAGPLPRTEALTIALRLAEALAAAHRAGVVHRDVKPANVVLRPDGSPVLIDFGLARFDDLPGLTASNVALGTPAYWAPEQAAGARADARSDLFGLGRILEESLVDDPSVSQGSAGLDPDLRAVLSACTAALPSDRYASADELGQDLQALLEGRAPAVAPARDRGLGVGALIAVAAAALLGAVALTLSGGVDDEVEAGKVTAVAPQATQAPSEAAPRVRRWSFAHPRVSGARFLPGGGVVSWGKEGRVGHWVEGEATWYRVENPIRDLAPAPTSWVAVDDQGVSSYRPPVRSEGPLVKLGRYAPIARASWHSLAIASDGQSCLAVSRMHGLHWLGLPDLKLLAHVRLGEDVHAAVFAPDGQSCVVATGNTRRGARSAVVLLELPSGRELERWSLAMRPRSVAISADSRWIVCGDQIGSLVRVDRKLRTLEAVAEPGQRAAHKGRVVSVRFLEGTSLVSVSGEPELRARLRPNTVRRWRVAEVDQVPEELFSSKAELLGLDVSAEGEALLIVEGAGQVRISPLP
jgi:predicted Ser/Thr protein kinase